MATQGGRKFHEQFPQRNVDEQGNENDHYSGDIFKFIRDNVIGKDLTFHGPFGKRRVVHCDYTASARSLGYIEDYIRGVVLPHYGNSHTTTSVTSLQTTMFCSEARDVVRKSVNASENDAVVFTGNGCTAAVHKLIHALMLDTPPVVFVSPYEHHSNLLPWKEIGGHVVWTRTDSNGGVDFHHLEENLKAYQGCGRTLIGCFSAASNVTGVLVDTDAVAVILHKYNALAFFDYATAGPYVTINMNPCSSTQSNPSYKDAIFLSCHKFVGGPGTPGVLVAKKRLFMNPVPLGGGGGSVFFVTHNTHRYLKEVEVKEEGGTPDLVGAVRAGIVFQLKDHVGCENISLRDAHLVKTATKFWKSSSNLILLGEGIANKLPIFSFVIKHPQSGRLLHHNYVAVLLNDLFGIQSRGGCACAGPYAQQLLGMSEDIALEIESLLLEDQRLDRHHLRRHREYSDKEVLRPGFTRINLPYFYDDATVSFVLNAVHLISEYGWKLLPRYMFNPETGEWKCRNYQLYKDRKWIGSIKHTNVSVIPPLLPAEEDNESCESILSKAEEILLKSNKGGESCGDQTLLFGSDGEALRWFLLPCEAENYLNNRTPGGAKGAFAMPFFPGRLVSYNGGDPKEDKLRILSSLVSHYCSCSPLHMRLMNQKVSNVNNNKESLNAINGVLANGNANSTGEKSCNGFIPSAWNDSESFHGNSPQPINQLPVASDDMLPVLVSSFPETDDSEESVQSLDLCSLKPTLPCALPLKQRDETSNGSQSAMEDIANDLLVKFHNPPKQIFSLALEGLEHFRMIENNDRVLLCISGGKDSLSMLHVINQYKHYAKKKSISFQFGAVTVDPQSAGYDPSPLKAYLAQLNVPYYFEEQDIIGAAADLPFCESICSFCSRMKRGRIYACARREGYNVIAMGQHLDDIAESFLMSTFHNGYLRSMKANYTVREGDLRVIRPLIYVREKDLRSFADCVKLPVIPENCPACFEAPKERHRMKQLLAQQEVLFPKLFKSLRAALHPLIGKSRTGLEKGVLDSALINVDDDQHDEDEETK